MDNDQTTPPATDPAATPADQSAPAPVNDASMDGDAVVDTAKEVLSNEPAMDLGTPSTTPPTNDAPAGDVPASMPEAPSEEAASEETPSDSTPPAAV